MIEVRLSCLAQGFSIDCGQEFELGMRIKVGGFCHEVTVKSYGGLMRSAFVTTSALIATCAPASGFRVFEK